MKSRLTEIFKSDFLDPFYEENSHLDLEDYVKKVYEEWPHFEDVGYLIHLYLKEKI